MIASARGSGAKTRETWRNERVRRVRRAPNFRAPPTGCTIAFPLCRRGIFSAVDASRKGLLNTRRPIKQRYRIPATRRGEPGKPFGQGIGATATFGIGLSTTDGEVCSVTIGRFGAHICSRILARRPALPAVPAGDAIILHVQQSIIRVPRSRRTRRDSRQLKGGRRPWRIKTTSH
jgi:hypothetical protein